MPPAGTQGKESGVMVKRHLEGKSQQERVQIRKGLGSLRSLTVQPSTRQRYDKALERFFRYLDEHHLVLPKEGSRLDAVVSDYVEHLWATGEGRALAADTLAGIQDTQPQMKGRLQGSWRLLKTWNVNEIPCRAPPMPLDVLEALIGYFTFKNLPLVALSLLLGFHGLLRTGEILSLKRSHFQVHAESETVVISLGLTKGGKRQGAAESVSLRVRDITRRVQQWISTPGAPVSLVSSPAQWRKSFSDALEALEFTSFQFRPYSLRRGGATFLFRQQGSLDKLLIHGRWQSTKSARLYINEGLAVLAELQLKWSRFARTLRTQYLNSLRQVLPSLEPTPKGRAGGGGKNHRRKQSRRKNALPCQ